MKSPEEYHIDAQVRLKWVVAGDGAEPRRVEDMRAIIEWIDRAVDAWLLDGEGCFEGAMLQGMFDGMFTVASIDGAGDLMFRLTEYGRARVESMPNDLRRLTKDGIK